MLYQGLKKIPVVPVSRPTLFLFLPTLLFFQQDWPCDPIFSGWLRAARTAYQNGVCCHNNIDVGTLLKIAQQKTAKTMKQIFKKMFISDLPTLIFSRYETGTTGFFRPNEENYTVCSWGQTVSTLALGKSTVNERWHSSHNVDALKTVILYCTNTIIKDSFVHWNCPYIFCFWTSKLYVGIKTHDSEVVFGTSWLLSLYQIRYAAKVVGVPVRYG